MSVLSLIHLKYGAQALSGTQDPTAHRCYSELLGDRRIEEYNGDDNHSVRNSEKHVLVCVN